MAADYTYVYQNLAIGGGIYNSKGMKELADEGFTHIIDCQAEFDDTPLAKPYGIKVLWSPLFDDFADPDPKEFARIEKFIKQDFSTDVKMFKLFAHCAAGVHRGPMVGYLMGRVLGEDPKILADNIEYRRQIASLAPYRRAVDNYVAKKNQSPNKRK